MAAAATDARTANDRLEEAGRRSAVVARSVIGVVADSVGLSTAARSRLECVLQLAPFSD